MEIEEDLAELDEDVGFLFDGQIIQDERLFSLEQTSDEILGELDLVEDDLESERIRRFFPLFKCLSKCKNIVGWLGLASFVQISRRKEIIAFTNVDFHIFEVDGGNSFVAEIEVRVETLEGTAADHETRISAAETGY